MDENLCVVDFDAQLPTLVHRWEVRELFGARVNCIATLDFSWNQWMWSSSFLSLERARPKLAVPLKGTATSNLHRTSSSLLPSFLPIISECFCWPGCLSLTQLNACYCCLYSRCDKTPNFFIDWMFNQFLEMYVTTRFLRDFQSAWWNSGYVHNRKVSSLSHVACHTELGEIQTCNFHRWNEAGLCLCCDKHMKNAEKTFSWDRWSIAECTAKKLPLLCVSALCRRTMDDDTMVRTLAFPCKILDTLRPHAHRTRSTLQHVHANCGTHYSKWECSHRLQATSKDLRTNLRANLLRRPVWTGPKITQATHINFQRKNLWDFFAQIT